MSAWSGTRRTSSLSGENRQFPFPKKNRLLKSSEFRRVYDNGSRYSGPLFTAFLLATEEPGGPRVGFTTPRALGKAVRRNFMKRRLREAVRRQLPSIPEHWHIVINPRSALHDASWGTVEKELRRLVARCGNP